MPRAKFTLIHFVAECRDCGWTNQDYVKGRDAARRHANKTNHRVRVDLGFIGDYFGKRYDKKPSYSEKGLFPE